jgi:hypothetical protein
MKSLAIFVLSFFVARFVARHDGHTIGPDFVAISVFILLFVALRKALR